jgi:DNA repair protein RadC
MDSVSLVPSARPLRVLRETPATRIATAGVGSVSLLELLGAVLGDADLALRLLTQYPTLPDLARARVADLETVYGLGPARAAALLASLELGRRTQVATRLDRLQIRSPADAALLLLGEMGALDQEQLRVVLLDTRNRVIAVETVYVGSLNAIVVRPAEVFREAVRRNACAVIVVHNHPSGSAEESVEDIATTKSLIAAGHLLDIQLLDHLIVAQGQWTSLKEKGLAFPDDEAGR